MNGSRGPKDSAAGPSNEGSDASSASSRAPESSCEGASGWAPSQYSAKGRPSAGMPRIAGMASEVPQG